MLRYAERREKYLQEALMHQDTVIDNSYVQNELKPDEQLLW